ncbi:MAG: DUF3810 family protein, partial [Vicinamibacterales bacterium]
MTVTRRTLVEIAVVALALVMIWAPTSPGLIEYWFSTGLYPAVQRTVTPFSNYIPIALLDVLGATAMTVAAVVLIRAVRSARRGRRVQIVMTILGRLTVAAAVIYLAFLLLWGLNYRRVPMGERLSVAPGSPAPEAVVQLGLDAAAQLNALHDAARRAGWQQAPWENTSLLRAFEGVQRTLSDARPSEPGRLKRSLLGPYFRWTSVDGMINPFGLEVL